MKSIHKGVLCILSSAFFFALMSMFVRLSGDLPFIQKCFFRNLVALIMSVAVLVQKKISIRCKKEELKFLFIRAFFGTLGLLCNFYAVDHLVLSDATMLNKMSPFFVIILSYFFLKEKISFIQMSAVTVAFIGSLFIIKPTFANLDLFPSLIGLCGGFGAGAAYTAVRHLGTRGVKGPVIVCFFSSFSCLVTLPSMIFMCEPMTTQQFIYLICAGLAAAGGQFSITAAYTFAPAKEISVYDYSQVVFSAILGFLVFGQKPDRYSVIGYVIICGTAVGMFFYRKQKSKTS